MPPSIAIATPVLGVPGTMRVVLNYVEQQQQRHLCFYKSPPSAADPLGAAPARLDEQWM